ncbi:MAG TPA: calcium-binding protein [Rhodospirillales bacterium]|nr:calcium-binding protein [Rhodospirillales bacterium]
MATRTGTNGSNILRGTSDSDVLIGRDGDDVLYGRSEGDVLRGDAGDDRLFGQGGDDTLIGGRGEDLLSGSTADNTFIFGRNSGEDVITDFWDGDENLIDVSAYGIKRFGDLDIDASTAGVMIDLGKSVGGSGNVNTVTLLGFDENDLDAGDFIFVA